MDEDPEFNLIDLAVVMFVIIGFILLAATWFSRYM